MTYEEAEALIREHMDYGGNVKVAALAKALSTSTLTFHQAAVAALEAATKSLNAAGASDDKALLDYLDNEDNPVDTIYFDDGKIIDVAGRRTAREAIRAAIAKDSGND